MTIEPYSTEWWDARFGTFTGSELHKLMTEPKSKSASISTTAETYILEKVWEKLAKLSRQGVDNFATEWGNENEKLAKLFYSKITGNKVIDPYLVYRDDIEGFTGTPDGFVGEDGLIEIKCPWNGGNHLKHCCITDDGYFLKEHKEYYWQIQAYLLLTGRSWCDFVSFDPRINSDLGLFIYRVKADAEQHELIIEKIKTARELFWQFYNMFNGTVQ